MWMNPKVSLELREVTAYEAADTLSRASGISLEFLERRKAEVEPALREAFARLEERASFAWVDQTFARALRELCWRYALGTAHWVHGGYTLVPRTEAPDNRAGAPVSDFRADGLQVFPEYATWNVDRRLHFIRTGAGSRPTTPPAGNRDSLIVSVGVEVGEEDPGRLAAVRNWRAVDDRGTVLLPSLTPEVMGDLEFIHAAIGEFPDEWKSSTVLPAPAPGATRLELLEGDLMQFETYRCERVEFPLPLREGTARAVVGEVALEVLRFWGEGEGAETWGEGCGPAVRVVMRKPPDVLVASPGCVNRLEPVLLGAAGKPFVYDLLDSDGFCKPGEDTVDLLARWEPRGDAPERLVLELAVKSGLERRLRFRLGGVPLPV